MGKVFKREVLENKKDVVVFFHSLWCIECPEMLEDFMKLSDKYGNVEDLAFVQMDSFKNEEALVPDAFDGQPYLRLWKAGQKDTFVQFEGNFVLSNMAKWLEKELNLKEEL